MTTLHARSALLPDGWHDDVRIALAAGRIAGIQTGTPPLAQDERHAVLIPALANVHSHAFQRAMAGLAEVRGPQNDSFWSWRTVMYRFALSMTPDDVEAVAAQAYVEMLEAGFSRVGEFHYLHHDRDGAPYADSAELATRIGAASAQTGIGLTLLPVFYAHSGFGGAAPDAGQRRFINSIDSFAQLLQRCRTIVGGLDGARLGVAPHSLRAVTPDQLAAILQLCGDGPVHIHVAEQTREVEDCIVWSGARPVQWLLDHAAVDTRWCLIHATHMTPAEIASLARRGAVAGLCPITEANLGDGIFPAPPFLAKGGQFGIGSDSNVLIALAQELRQLEYSQRLGLCARNIIAEPAGSTARSLFDGALRGGARSTGVEMGLTAGADADIIALNTDAVPYLVGDQWLDNWLFAGGVGIDDVWARGRQQVRHGRHLRRDAIAQRFAATMTRLLQS